MSLDEIAALAPTHIIISPGPCTPKEAGISVDVVRRFGANHRHTTPDDIQPRNEVHREIYFSHAQHVATKEVECVTCHVGLDEVDLSSARNMPTMTTCNTCHNDHKVEATRANRVTRTS